MIGEEPLATRPIAGDETLPIPLAPFFFDTDPTVLSQYANSPIILALVNYFSQWLDPKARFDQFFANIRDIDSAVGYGLDLWGRILDVSRILRVPTAAFVGFSQDGQAQTFGFGIWYSGTAITDSVVLLDDPYRTLLLVKAAFNITDCSTPAINALLLALFGQGYVVDNLDLTMTFTFPEPLTVTQLAIIESSNVVPRPSGVSFNVVQL